MEKFQGFDLLWIQSAPSIAAIFYQKYLKNTHALLCPDDVVNYHQQHPREIAKTITTVMNSNERKKVAIHFMTQLSIKRREAIFNSIKKFKPDHSSYCLSIPSTAFQSNLLLGWSAEIQDEAWKRRCQVEFEPESFSAFTPPTLKSGQSEWTEFIEEFVISNKRFSKKALIVDLTENMITFQVDKGICFNPGVQDAINGWISASRSLPSTLIWIIKEKNLYVDFVNNKLQEKREKLLAEYRKILITSIELFATDIPIYCYTIDYFATTATSLAHCLAQIQHRHHLCLSRSILLKYDDDMDLHQEYFSNMKTVHLKKSPLFNESKWNSIFSSFLKEIYPYAHDNVAYISPRILDIKGDLDDKQYKIPLLSLNNSELSILSKFETIGTHDASHTVSAKTYIIYDKWAQILMDMQEKDNGFHVHLSQITEKGDLRTLKQVAQELNVDVIKSFVNNDVVFQRGEKLQNTLSDTRYEIASDDNLLKISASAKGTALYPYLVTITLNFEPGQQMIQEVTCPCPAGQRDGPCKHCVATVLYFLHSPNSFELWQPSSLSVGLSSPVELSCTNENLLGSSLSSSNSSIGKKRHSDKLTSREDHETGKKIKSPSSQSEGGYGSDAIAPYDPNKSSGLSKFSSLRSFEEVTVIKKQVESATSIVQSDKTDNSSGNSCNTSQVYTADSTLNQHANSSLSASSSSTMSLPPIPDSYHPSPSRSVYTSSLSSSKKSLLSVPTIPSSESLSSNGENILPSFREEEEIEYRLLEQREEISTVPSTVPVNFYDDSSFQGQYEADIDEEDDIRARIEYVSARDTQPERQRLDDGAATPSYNGSQATQIYYDSDATQPYHGGLNDDNVEARIEEVLAEDTLTEYQSHVTQPYIDLDVTQLYQNPEISDDDFNYNLLNEPVLATNSQQERQYVAASMSTQENRHSTFDSEKGGSSKNSIDTVHQDESVVQLPDTQQQEEAPQQGGKDTGAVSDDLKSSSEDNDETGHERATLYATQSSMPEPDDDLQEVEDWLGDLI